MGNVESGVSGAAASMMAKQQLKGIVGTDGEDKPNTEKTDRMRRELEEKRQGQKEDYTARMAERKASLLSL